VLAIGLDFVSVGPRYINQKSQEVNIDGSRNRDRY
jgi:hypothetical protein